MALVVGSVMASIVSGDWGSSSIFMLAHGYLPRGGGCILVGGHTGGLIQCGVDLNTTALERLFDHGRALGWAVDG